jgi:hypothetical protein
MGAACVGFASYDVLGDMRVAVNDTVPVWNRGSPQEARAAQIWDEWGADIRVASRGHDFPATWLVGIMSVESAGNTRACSPCMSHCCGPVSEKLGHGCCAYGLMQFIDMVARMYGASGPELIGNGPLAIDLAAHHLADLAYTGLSPSGASFGAAPYGLDLPKIASAYNSGSARCTGSGTFGLSGEHDYSMLVVRYANTAAALGIPAWPGASLATIAGVGIAVSGIAAAYALWRGKLRIGWLS